MWVSEVLKQTHFDIPENAEPIERYMYETVNLNGGLQSFAPGGRKMYIQD